MSLAASTGGGGGGGDGAGGGGHGKDEEEGDADDFFIGAPDDPGRGLEKAHMYEHGGLCEAKDAMSLLGYNGKDKGCLWRKGVAHHLTRKYPDI